MRVIEIVPYDERWPGEFAEIAAAVRRAVGELAVRVDHIGSTSVPGLAAKNIIDVQLGVASLEPEELLRAALATAGYTAVEGGASDHRPPGATGPEADWEKRLYKPPPGHRPTNLHVRVIDRQNWRYALLFRDYLRSHPQSAAAYAELKRCLAEYHAADRRAYTEIKDPVCDIIIAGAEAWAAATRWEP